MNVTNVVELHPEDLLDKEIRGELSSDERVRLDTHLKHCSACNLERGSRADFKEDFESLGRAMQIQGMLTLAIKAGTAAPQAAPVAKRTRRLRPLLLIAAAFLLLATGAAAAKWTEGRRLFVPQAPVPSGADGRHDEKPKGKGGRGAPLENAPPPVTVVLPPEVPTPASVTAALPVETVAAPLVRPPPTAPTRPTRSGTENASPLPRPGEGSASVATSFAGAPASRGEIAAPSPRTAASVFDDANSARQSGNYGSAISLYRELDERFAASPEAKSAEAILGRLFLDRGDAEEAVRAYDAYLARGGGALREEVLVGRAVGLGRLGRARAEREAWGALVREFPRSVHAEEARARLSTLGAE